MEGIMNTSTGTGTSTAARPGVGSRLLKEGYGPGAWHGPDLKAALADVTPAVAHCRPAPGRHSIAEVALHHAYYVHNVSTQLSGGPEKPFALPGEDWFAVADETAFAWSRVVETVEAEQLRLAEVVAAIEGGTSSVPMGDGERLDLIIGITCHAVYHAGQIQLIKRLRGEQ
jgi:DinB superfamily